MTVVSLKIERDKSFPDRLEEIDESIKGFEF